MATARPLAAGPPTCRATSPNLNKDARIRRRPDKDEDRDGLKVGESAWRLRHRGKPLGSAEASSHRSTGASSQRALERAARGMRL